MLAVPGHTAFSQSEEHARTCLWSSDENPERDAMRRKRRRRERRRRKMRGREEGGGYIVRSPSSGRLGKCVLISSMSSCTSKENK